MANPTWFIAKPDSPEISFFSHLITSQQKGRDLCNNIGY